MLHENGWISSTLTLSLTSLFPSNTPLEAKLRKNSSNLCMNSTNPLKNSTKITNVLGNNQKRNGVTGKKLKIRRNSVSISFFIKKIEISPIISWYRIHQHTADRLEEIRTNISIERTCARSNYSLTIMVQFYTIIVKMLFLF